MSGMNIVSQTSTTRNGLSESIRTRLYEGTGLRPIFNPMEVPEELPPPLVVDLTRDVSNLTRIYHNKTAEVQALLAQADAIVVESQRLAEIIEMAVQPQRIVVAPFGFSQVQSTETGEVVVGLLDYIDEQAVVNLMHQDLWRRMETKPLVLSQVRDSLTWPSGEVTDSFMEFCRAVDILLLPGADKIIPSLALPLSVMLAGAAVIATPEYACDLRYEWLTILEDSPAAIWDKVIGIIGEDRQRLESLKQSGRDYAQAVCEESRLAVKKLARQLGVG